MNDQQIFRNDEVDLSALPSTEEVTVHPLQSSYLTMQVITNGLATLFFLVLTVIALPVIGLPVWALIAGLGFWILVGAVQMVFIIKGFPYKGYALRSRDIFYRKGWLYKQQVTVPFSRIQHVDIKEGVLERMFEISRLNIYTAGGQSSDLTIPGLTLDESQRIRSFILGIMTSDEEE